MDEEVRLDCVYVPSEDIVARDIEGELIIVPLVSGIGDLEDELFTFNETGRAIWDKFDGKRKLSEIVSELCEEFMGEKEKIESDVIGLTYELLKRKIVVKT